MTKRRSKRARQVPAGESSAAPEATRIPGGTPTPTPASTLASLAPPAGAARWWWVAIPAALALLAWACRGAPLGTAVADDYSFLDRLRFHALDVFDSMGATYYWRPVSRQLYFGLVGPWLLAAPWAAALLNAALLAGTGAIVLRIARRWVAASVAAAIAAAVLLSEPARVLLAWPSGAQHLLAGLFAALAVHEALAGRLVTTGLAALAGVLSHESAALALPLVPVAAWRARHERRRVLAAIAVTAGVLLVWAAGYAVALGHGVRLPGGLTASAPAAPADGDNAEAYTPLGSSVTTRPATVVSNLPSLAARAKTAALNLEDVHGTSRVVLIGGYLAVLAVAVILLARGASRARRRSALPLVATAAAWFGLGILPLALLLPDWNAWRAWTPTLGFTVAATALAGAASPWLAGAWVALRLAALMVSPAAPLEVSRMPPQDGSHVSFSQLVRLQRMVRDTRQALLARHRELPAGGVVCYWMVPRLAEFAFQGSRALRVWYADSTLMWGRFGGMRGMDQRFAAAVEFRYDERPFAVSLPIESVALFQQAMRAAVAKDYTAVDSLLARAAQGLGNERYPFRGSIAMNMALNAYHRGDRAAADSLRTVAAALGVDSPVFWAFTATLAAERGDVATATDAARKALERDPTDPDVIRLARALGLEP